MSPFTNPVWKHWTGRAQQGDYKRAELEKVMAMAAGADVVSAALDLLGIKREAGFGTPVTMAFSRSRMA